MSDPSRVESSGEKCSTFLMSDHSSPSTTTSRTMSFFLGMIFNLVLGSSASLLAPGFRPKVGRKGSLLGNNKTNLDYTSDPAQSERDLSLTHHIYSRKIFNQEWPGGQTLE